MSYDRIAPVDYAYICFIISDSFLLGQCIQYSSDMSVPIHIRNKFIQNSNENCPKYLNQVQERIRKSMQLSGRRNMAKTVRRAINRIRPPATNGS